MFKTREGVVVGLQIFAWAPNKTKIDIRGDHRSKEAGPRDAVLSQPGSFE